MCIFIINCVITYYLIQMVPVKEKQQKPLTLSLWDKESTDTKVRVT